MGVGAVIIDINGNESWPNVGLTQSPSESTSAIDLLLTTRLILALEKATPHFTVGYICDIVSQGVLEEVVLGHIRLYVVSDKTLDTGTSALYPVQSYRRNRFRFESSTQQS